MFSWLGTLGKIVGGLGHWVANPIGSFGHWFLLTFLGNPSNPQTPFGFLFQMITGQLNPVQFGAVGHLYAIMAPIAITAISAASAARYFKLMKDDQVAPSMALYDVAPRWLILVGLLAPPANIAYHVFGWVSAGVSQFAWALTLGLFHATSAGHVGGTLASAFGTDIMSGVIAAILGGEALVSVVFLFGLALAALVIYLLVLMVMRSVMLVFGLVFMPIALPIAAYDTHNAFFRWWLGTVMGALIAQIVGGAGFTITIVLALNTPSPAGIGLSTPAAAVLKVATTLLMLDAGFLFTAKAVKAAEGGTMSGAGMGIGGLVEVLALTPRAARNLVGSAPLSSGSFTRRPVGEAAGSGGAGWGQGGGGGGGGGWGAGPRGMARGFLFPRHNVSADVIGVTLGTVVGAEKGVLHPEEGQRRSHSLVLGAQQGARMAMGRGLASDSHAQFAVGTIAGRHQEAELNERLNAIQTEVAPHLSPSQLDDFQTDRAQLHSWVTEQNLQNDQGRWHPGRVGATSPLTHPQRLELDQRVEQLRRNYSALGDVPRRDEPPPPPSPDGE